MWIRSLFDAVKRRPAPGRRRGERGRLRLEPLEGRRLLSGYSVVGLGMLSGHDLNNHGQVVGFGQNQHAALWQNGVTTDLGALGFVGAGSLAVSVADSGHVVGHSFVRAGSAVRHGFLVTPEDTNGDGDPDRWFRDGNGDGLNDLMTDLGAGGRAESYAYGVNSHGHAVGMTLADGLSNPRAFIWRNGVMTDLGTLGGSTSQADAINDAGQVVGYAHDHNETISGFLINPEDTNGDGAPDRWFRDADGDGGNDLMVALPSILFNSDINAVGQVLEGESLWTPDTPNGTTGTVTTLPLSTGGLNAAGVVVGTFGGLDGGIWDSNSAANLNWLIPEGFYVTAGLAINDSGSILACNFDASPYLLTPTDLPYVSVGDAAATEGADGGTAAFAVTLSNASTQPVTVRYSTADGQAVAPGDYRAVTGTLTFAPGETSKTVNVEVVDDDRAGEPAEEFRLRLSDPTNAYLTNHTSLEGRGTIVDNDLVAMVTVGIDSPGWVVEGNAGTTAAVFTLTLTRAYDRAMTFDYSTYDGDGSLSEFPPAAAAAGSDYQATTGTLTFAPGETSKQIAVPVIGDRAYEPGVEVFMLALHGSSLNGVPPFWVGGGYALAWISDDEPSMAVEWTSVVEGNAGTSAMVFTVSLAAAYDLPVTVHYATADLTARSATDYVATSGVLTFAPGETTRTVTVPVRGDAAVEPEEYFYLTLSGASVGGITEPNAVGTIQDDDLRVSVGDASAREGDSGTTLLTFTARLAQASDQYVWVNYETADGTAVAGDDYDAGAGTITFPPGATSQTFTVAVHGDGMQEDDETFTVNFTGGGVTTVAVGTILDDDGPPAISVGDVRRKEGRRGRYLLYFVVTLSAPSGKEVSVNFATADGTARASDRDYIARAGTLVFAPGQTRKTVTVTVMGDGRREADETLLLNLSAPVNATLRDAQGVGTILNDDR